MDRPTNLQHVLGSFYSPSQRDGYCSPIKYVTLEFKNMNPITIKEGLTEDIYKELSMQEDKWINIKSLSMAPWGTQQAALSLVIPLPDA
jgi:hypothetical protein